MVARDAPRLGVALIVASLAINVLALLLPLVMLQVFDRIIPNQAVATLTVLAAALAVALALDLALKLCRIVVLTQEGEGYEFRLSLRVARAMLAADSTAFGRLRSGEHHERIAAVGALRDHHAGAARLMSVDLPFSMIFVAAIWLIGGDLVAVPLAGFTLLAAFSVVTKVLHRPVLALRRQLDEQRYSFVYEFLTQIVTLKSARMEPQMLRRYEVLQDRSIEINRRMSVVSQFGMSFSSVFSTGSVAAMALAGAYLVIDGRLAAAELAACMLLNGRTVQPMLRLLGYWPQLEAAEASRSKLVDLFSVPRRDPGTNEHKEISGHLEIRDLKVEGRDGRSCFNGLSITVPPGECLVVQGPDRSGKTLLLRSVLGEVAPTSGRVLIDGQDACAVLEQRGRGRIAIVDRDPVIFDGTIIENVSLFGGEEAQRRARAVAQEIGLADEIDRLPHGWNTEISIGGIVSSTRGLAQLIAIARVLVLEPALLLFNEANIALDHTLDSRVREALARRKGKTTLVLISRRPSWQALAEHRIDLGDTRFRAWDDDLAREQVDAPPFAEQPPLRLENPARPVADEAPLLLTQGKAVA